jgi:hypothetical protein
MTLRATGGQMKEHRTANQQLWTDSNWQMHFQSAVERQQSKCQFNKLAHFLHYSMFKLGRVVLGLSNDLVVR